MLKRSVTCCVILSFILTAIAPMRGFSAQLTTLNLPAVGSMVNLSSAYKPLMVTGLTVHPDNPLLMDFIVSTGNSQLSNKEDIKKESDRLIKYFLATLTIPEEDQWVNLSPYEKDRIIPQELGQTELGRDMLAQDYILKQLTASFIYPEQKLGQEFWNKIYEQARQRFGTSQIPVNTFNKVWILPDSAKVFTHQNSVFVIKSHLTVMLEEDYLAFANNQSQPRGHVQKEQQNVSSSTLPTSQPMQMKAPQVNPPSRNVPTSSLSSQIIKEIILPAIENEVNTGENFATLRQIYNSMILAVWYKNNLKEALLNQVYVDKKKMSGVTLDDHNMKEKIYQQYLQAYKKGVFNYIKEDIDESTKEKVAHKYFSGGIKPISQAMISLESSPAQAAIALRDNGNMFNIRTSVDPAMFSFWKKKAPKVLPANNNTVASNPPTDNTTLKPEDNQLLIKAKSASEKTLTELNELKTKAKNTLEEKNGREISQREFIRTLLAEAKRAHEAGQGTLSQRDFYLKAIKHPESITIIADSAMVSPKEMDKVVRKMVAVLRDNSINPPSATTDLVLWNIGGREHFVPAWEDEIAWELARNFLSIENNEIAFVDTQIVLRNRNLTPIIKYRAKLISNLMHLWSKKYESFRTLLPGESKSIKVDPHRSITIVLQGETYVLKDSSVWHNGKVMGDLIGRPNTILLYNNKKPSARIRIYKEGIPQILRNGTRYTFDNLLPIPLIVDIKDSAMNAPDISSEKKAHFKDDDKNKAMLTLPLDNRTRHGGINLNSKNLKMDQSGSNIDIKFNPTMIAQFKRGDFSGIQIKILDVIPIVNFMPLLGLREEDENKLAKT